MDEQSSTTQLSRRTALTVAAGGAVGLIGFRATEAAFAAPRPGHGMWVGANRILPSPTGTRQRDVETWLAGSAAHGPWTVRRTYSPRMSGSLGDSTAQEMLDAGIHIHHSVKPPKGVTWKQAVDGRYHADLVALACALPRKGPTWLTVHHEPEGSAIATKKDDYKGTPEDFAAFHRYCYRIVKAVNRNVQVGPIYMSHQWRPGMDVTARPARWFVGNDAVDFVAVDAYWPTSEGMPRGMHDYPQFRRWYAWARKAYPSVRFGLTEFGYQYVRSCPSARADAITATARFLTQEHFFTMQYWDVVGDRHWALDGDPAAIAAYRAACAAGRRH